MKEEFKSRVYTERLKESKPEVHGQWKKDIDNKRKWDRVRYYCSSCGDWQTYGEPKYCPNCGAKMDESEDSGNG